MKGVQKLGLLILAALMLAGVAACDRAGGSARQGRGERWPGPEPQDLGGLVFKIADNTNFRFLPRDTELGTPMGDLKHTIMESIMEDFNVTFDVVRITENDMLNQLTPAVMAGDLFAHIIISTTWAFGGLISAGLLGDISAVPTLNLDSDLWMRHVHRATTVRGEVLATAGIFEHWDRASVVVFQKSLWNQLNLPDPYELVRRGEWTWDRFEEFAVLAAQDLTGDGVVDNINDRWGMAVIPDDFMRATVLSMGGRFFDFHPVTGRLYSPMATPEGIAIADWLRYFSLIPGAWYRGPGQNNRTEMFINRRALFMPHDLHIWEVVRAMDDDFGILPYPKRNAEQPEYLSVASHNAMLIGIPITNNQLEETGIIMEALAARFAPVREMQRAELEDIVLRSDEDIEMLDYIIPNLACDIGFIMAIAGPVWNTPMGTLYNYTFNHTVNDFASEIESRRMAMEVAINEVFFNE